MARQKANVQSSASMVSLLQNILSELREINIKVARDGLTVHEGARALNVPLSALSDLVPQTPKASPVAPVAPIEPIAPTHLSTALSITRSTKAALKPLAKAAKAVKVAKAKEAKADKGAKGATTRQWPPTLDPNFVPWFLNSFCQSYRGRTLSVRAVVELAYLQGFDGVTELRLTALSKQYPNIFRVVKHTDYEDLVNVAGQLKVVKARNPEQKRLSVVRFLMS